MVDTTYTGDKMKEITKKDANHCFVYMNKDLEDNDVTLVKCGEENRKEIKKAHANVCTVCSNEGLEDNDVTLMAC